MPKYGKLQMPILVFGNSSFGPIKLPKNGCPRQWPGPQNLGSCLLLFVHQKSAPHPIHQNFWCPFAPSQSPPHLQNHLPLPFYCCKKVTNIISTHLPVFQCLFFPGQRCVCSLTSNLLCFLTVLAAFQAISPFHVCSLALRFEWLI